MCMLPSTPEAPRVDKGVVRFRGILKKLGLVFGAEKIVGTSDVRKLQRRQHIVGGGEIVEAAEVILQVLHHLDEPSMAFGFRLALVKRLEELRRIAQFLFSQHLAPGQAGDSPVPLCSAPRDASA